MQLLFCCEFYHPSRGGVQEVMRQIAERMVQWGHDVTVATTRLAERKSCVINGVKIEEFGVCGNLVRGLEGSREIERYREFLAAFPGDAVMIKAAQQWTFDAAWPVLDRIRARKVFIPCGFSGLFLPAYKGYFRSLPDILRKFDHLVFYAERYRDIDFAREHGLNQLTVLTNGASESEFAVPRDPGFRDRHGIAKNAFLLLTVGTPIDAKGHTELAAALAKLETGDRPVALILNGQWPKLLPSPARMASPQSAPPVAHSSVGPLPSAVAAMLPRFEIAQSMASSSGIDGSTPHVSLLDRIRTYVGRALAYGRANGLRAFVSRAMAGLFNRSVHPLRRIIEFIRRAYFKTRRHGYAVLQLITPFLHRAIWRVGGAGTHALQSLARLASARITLANPVPQPKRTIDDWIAMASAMPGKQVLKTHFDREETVQAFLNADLFVFASNIEYSPLVLFEAAAAGTPFLTVPVGNADEIVRWTGGGEICPAARDALGYTRVDPTVLAGEIRRLIENPERRKQLGAAGREAWRTTYNWGAIALRYEAILRPSTQEKLEFNPSHARRS